MSIGQSAVSTSVFGLRPLVRQQQQHSRRTEISLRSRHPKFDAYKPPQRQAKLYPRNQTAPVNGNANKTTPDSCYYGDATSASLCMRRSLKKTCLA